MSIRPTPFLPPQVAVLLRAGRKIEAIKLAMDSNPGLGLRDAKDTVEAYERQLRSGQAPGSLAPSRPVPVRESESGPEPAGAFPAAAREALRQGQTIVAIKIVREAYGLGLREAKQRVESYAEKGEAALADFVPGARALPNARKPRGPIGDSGRTVAPGDRGGGAWLVALVLATVAAVAWYFVGA